MISIFQYKSPLGRMIMAGDDNGLTGLWFEEQKYFGSILPEHCEEKKLCVFEQTVQWLDLYFSGQIPYGMPPINLKGSKFQEEVWKILCDIPYGMTITYGEIAATIAKKRGIARMSAQAVGGAVGRNPIAIIVPCHRVIGADGSLTGYAGGLDRKAELLKIEKETGCLF